MKVSELRKKDINELLALGAELKQELFQLRMQLYTGQLDKPSRIRKTRRTIARVKTVLRSRNI